MSDLLRSAIPSWDPEDPHSRSDGIAGKPVHIDSILGCGSIQCLVESSHMFKWNVNADIEIWAIDPLKRSMHSISFMLARDIMCAVNSSFAALSVDARYRNFMVS